jgi:cell division protein FtsZ
VLGGYGSKDEPAPLGQDRSGETGESERSSFGSLGTLPPREVGGFTADRDRDRDRDPAVGAAEPAPEAAGEPKPSSPQVPSARPYDGGQVEELDVPDFLK